MGLRRRMCPSLTTILRSIITCPYTFTLFVSKLYTCPYTFNAANIRMSRLDRSDDDDDPTPSLAYAMTTFQAINHVRVGEVKVTTRSTASFRTISCSLFAYGTSLASHATATPVDRCLPLHLTHEG